jgi:geranylgeranyl diphosphate synthase, type II
MKSPTLSVAEITDLINNQVEQLPLPDAPIRLYEPIRYILNLGGKRLRPVLALMTHNLFSDNLDEVILPALSIEVFHNFSLVHDDIMDKAPLRRGQETVHKKWDDNVAILSGDAMLVKAYQLLENAPPENLSVLLNAFNKTAIEVCEGQQLDMDFENRLFDNNAVTEAEYMNMIKLKTAVLFGFSFQFGGITGSGKSEIIRQLYSAGVQLGFAFQLQDDLLDSYGGEKFGKQVGGDIINAKKTYLLVKVLEVANDKDYKDIINIMGNADLARNEKVNAILEYYDRYQIKDIVQSKIELHLGYFHESISNIDSIRGAGMLNYVNSLANRSV